MWRTPCKKPKATWLIFTALPVTWSVRSHCLQVLMLAFPGPRLSTLAETPDASHGVQVSAGLLRHESRVSKNTAPHDSRPPYQSMTEGSSRPGGLAQDIHPQPHSQMTSHATHAHVGIPTDLPTLCSWCCAQADSEFVVFTFPRQCEEHTDHSPLLPTCKEDVLPPGQDRTLRLQ